MKSRRNTKKHSKGGGTPSSPPTPPPPPPCKLQTLIHALLQNSEGFNQSPILECLYTLLVQLSSQFDSASGKEDLSNLVNALFRQLQARFQQLFSALCSVDSVSASQQQSRNLSSICATSKEFSLLLSCCLVIITLPQLDQNLVLDKGIFILSVFTRLRNRHVIRAGVDDDEIKIMGSLSRKSTLGNGLTSSVDEDFFASLRFLKPSHSCLPLFCDLIEVFADEFVVRKSLRENLMLFDVLSSHDMLFASHSWNGDVRNVMELIACHFILSFSDEQACDSILERLSWDCRINRRVARLGIKQCVLLLLDSSFLSSPELFQSHLILMVSEAIGIDSGRMSTSLDAGLMNCYLLAFERSVILYTKHICALHIDGDYQGAPQPDLQAHGKSIHPSFDFFIRPATRRYVDQLLSKLDDSWHYYAKNATRCLMADLLSMSFAYIEENEGLFADTWKYKMLSFIKALTIVASEAIDTPPCEKVQASLPHMFLIASILKSMNASLLQVIRYLEKCGEIGNRKILKDFPNSKEYGVIVRVISCFQSLNDCLPLPKDPVVRDLLQGNKAKHSGSKQMLLHFCCFLSLGFRYKLEFLVKGCIFTLMTLLNLIIFEDGHLDSIDPLLVYLSGASADSVHNEVDEMQSLSQTIRKSSHVVASKFQKIQTFFSSQHAPRFSSDVSAENSNDEPSLMPKEEETCSGKMYLNCIFENSKSPPDVDDLSDFIECKRGKDYSEWLKEREKYRKWKVHKMAVLRWEKRKRTWHSIKGSKS